MDDPACRGKGPVRIWDPSERPNAPGPTDPLPTAERSETLHEERELPRGTKGTGEMLNALARKEARVMKT
jgi:hypothetical protein